MKHHTLAFVGFAICMVISTARAQTYLPPSPYYQQKHSGVLSGQPQQDKAPASHHYDVKRNGQFGYTDEDGEVHFFGNIQHTGNTYQFVAWGSSPTLMRCSDDCQIVDTFVVGGQRTFRPEKGTILRSFIEDLMSGALD